MSDAMPNHLENSLLNLLLRNATYVSSTDVFIALFTPVTAMSDTVLAGEVATPGGGGDGGYDRLTIGGGSLIFNAAGTTTAGQCENNENWDFVHDNASEPGWEVGSVAVMDHATTQNIANVLFYQNYTQQFSVPAGDTLRFSTGLFIVTLA